MRRSQTGTPRARATRARSILPLTFALAATAAFGVGCGSGETSTAKPDATATAAKPKPSVRFGAVVQQPLPQTLDISGTLAADEMSAVAAQANGIVVQILADVGARVKKGDPLVILDAKNAQLQAQAANAAVAQARARLALDGQKGGQVDPTTVPEVRAAKESMELAKADAERVKKLFESGALPQATWDEVRARAEQASAQYDAVVAGVRATAAALNSAQAQAGLAGKAVNDTTVRAPFDGAVSERQVSVGEFAGIGRVVAIVVKDNPLRLRIDVPESDVSSVELGKKVEVSVAAYPGKVFVGTIKRIGASLKAASRTLPVEAEFDNADGNLRPGFFAQGRITLGGEPSPAMLVPVSAVGTSGSSSRVFVRAGDRVTERLVKTGRKVGEMIEVIGPLREGEEVAVDKLDELSDGAEVVTASAAPEQPASQKTP
ncbi:MAG TPA: efflux RND transporter periplasmic adaptor subunit [Candidatus Nanopelagicales bacterium]|nr:efflux RND transporter periplasmic adaptor subunit [Candidatus Nanopelagicales bacterium]